MIEHIITTGDTGRLKIEDRTDDPDQMTVVLFVQSLSPVSISQLPWAYSKDATRSGWNSFNFRDTTLWQGLGSVYVGDSVQSFTLHLGDSGTSQLGGPTDHQVSLFGYVAPEDPIDPGPTGPTINRNMYVKVGDLYKRATPYVNVNGVWQIAQPFVRTERGWSEMA